MKSIKVNGEVPLRHHQNLALLQGVIIDKDRKISAYLSCRWHDSLHPPLSHCLLGRDLKIIKENWLFFEPWDVKCEWRKDFRCRAKHITWAYRDVLICPLLFFFSWNSTNTRTRAFSFATPATFKDRIPLFLHYLYFFHILSEFILAMPWVVFNC